MRFVSRASVATPHYRPIYSRVCGILGIVCPRNQRVALSRERFSHALGWLAHRGPDAQGVWDAGYAMLGHRRLVVVDRSSAGEQPMHFDDGSGAHAGVLVYNGELYNASEVQALLRERGAAWPDARSDARWFGRALAEFGEGAATKARLRGMYAAGYLNLRDHRLLLMRDALGIKPLYYSRVVAAGVSHVAFASELPALVELVSMLTGTSPEPDMVTASAYLTTIRTTLGERTLFRGCRSVLPGQVLTLDLDNESLACKVRSGVLDLENAADGLSRRPGIAHELSEHDAVLGTRRVIADSVVSHLDSDVPKCVLLSGGLDSAIIASIAGPHMREHGQPFLTFCAGAKDGESDSPDFAFAKLMAERLGSEHHEAIVTQSSFADSWSSMVRSMGLPLSTPNEVAIHRVSSQLRAKGCVVALSGEGADELFCGYDAALDNAFEYEQGGGVDPGLFQLTANAWVAPDAKRALLQDRAMEAAASDESLLAWYRTEFARAKAERENDHSLQAHSRFLRRVNLLGLLQRVDTATMLAGVEARTPFADARVMNWAESLALASKFETDRSKSPRGKLVLRRAFADHVPQEILTRPKASFPLPFEKWIAHEHFFANLSRHSGCDSLLESEFAKHVFHRDALDTVVSLTKTHWHLAWPVFNLLVWGERWWGHNSGVSTPCAASTFAG